MLATKDKFRMFTMRKVSINIQKFKNNYMKTSIQKNAATSHLFTSANNVDFPNIVLSFLYCVGVAKHSHSHAEGAGTRMRHKNR